MKKKFCFVIAAWVGGVFSFPVVAQDAPTTIGGTRLLEMEGDIASQLVDGVDRFLLKKLSESVGHRSKFWNRKLTTMDAYNQSIEPNRQRLSHILGMRDARVQPSGFEFVSTTEASSLVGQTGSYEIHEVRWRSFGNVYGEGLLLTPKARPVAFVVAIPNSDQTPEQLCGIQDGIAAEAQFARRLAENNCAVVVPTLIDRHRNQFHWHGRRVSIPHREFLYRSAFEVGRHLIGYELHKVFSAIDCFQLQQQKSDKQIPMAAIGFGDGGMLSLYAAALDTRIDATAVCGYFDDRNNLWKQPIDRNVFALLEQFGDAELATMVAPRKLIINDCSHPRYELPKGTGGAPAVLENPKKSVVSAEVARAQNMLLGWQHGDWIQVTGDGTGLYADSSTITKLLEAIRGPSALRGSQTIQPVRAVNDPTVRMERQMRQIDRHTQNVLRESAFVRQQFMSRLDFSSIEKYQQSANEYRNIFRHEVMGHFDDQMAAPNVRSRWMKSTAQVDYYEVVMDVYKDVIAYGILCLPRGIRADEKRPVVVCQHGLEGRPQDVIGESGFRAYKAFATELAKRGFVTFAPQNLYIFTDRFRSLQRKSYPLKKTLFSIIVPQHQQIVDWLQSLPFVDPHRVAFYGLSYGGKTAMRVPPLVTDYCLSICSADFNEWVDKNASTRNPRSYVWTGEYEIFEWDLGSTFNYAEMAALIAPRPFMVERGHYDGVADDWTVGWEFAKVRHLYQAKLKTSGICEIEWFDGPHTIHGKQTFDFLHKHLKWPKPKE